MKKAIKGKIFIIRRSYLAALMLSLAVVAIFYVINHPAVVGRDRQEHVLPIYSVSREEQVIALTFNLSATEDQHTSRVLTALNQQEITATFFVTGQWVRENPQLALEMAQAGHELMNLSDDHGLLRRLHGESLRENLLACSLVIYETTHTRPHFFRAPYGEYDSRLVETANSLGMTSVQWSIDSGDWRGLTADAIVHQVLNRSFSGGIVLLHSNLPQTAVAMPLLLQQLQEAGYEILPLSQLIYQGEYVVSLSGVQSMQ